MARVNSNPCPRLKIESETLIVSGAGVEMRVPIRRCLLGERMVHLLLQTEAGQNTASRILINGPLETPLERNVAQAPLEPTPEAAIRVAFGPDLEPIHPLDCTRDRCVASCSPSYEAILVEFGFHRTVLQTDEDGCGETAGDAFPDIHQAKG